MFVKTTNGQVDKFPYTIGEFRKDNSNTSFPKLISNDLLASFGVYPVEHDMTPAFNYVTQWVKTSNLPSLVNGKWLLTKTVIDKTEAQQEADNKNKAVNVRKIRDQKLAETDWRFRSDMTPSQEWKDYCQALRDVPSQDGFPWNVTWPTKPE